MEETGRSSIAEGYRRQRTVVRDYGAIGTTMIARAALGALVLYTGCGGAGDGEQVHRSSIESDGAVSIRGDVWADNWFAFYLGEKLILEDSVPITTERSFNAESFEFHADYPIQLNFVIQDFKENDTGLEYIGSPRQQMGDGGFIAQFVDTSSGQTIAVSNSDWRCLVVHEAPLDKACEDDANPTAGVGACKFVASKEPEGWKAPGYSEAGWINPTEYSGSAVGPKHGYDGISWDPAAKLIWTGDLETHNTILCRVTLNPPQ